MQLRLSDKDQRNLGKRAGFAITGDAALADVCDLESSLSSSIVSIGW